MCQSPRAAHDIVQLLSALVSVLNQSSFCCSVPGPALLVEADRAQLPRCTGTGSAVGSVLNLKCRDSNHCRKRRGGIKAVVLCRGGSFPCISPWLCCAWVCHFCACSFYFPCASVLMLLNLGTVSKWVGATGAPVTHGSLLMSGTVLCYTVWVSSSAHLWDHSLQKILLLLSVDACYWCQQQ